MWIPRTLVGAALLIFGRKAFWLFVAGVGFVAGLQLATRTFELEPGWILIVIAGVAGLLGALLALVFQSIGIGLAGFLGGGYIALSLFDATGWGQRLLADLPYRSGLIFIAGGVLGAILIGVLFDWALIVLSSVIGATLISQATPFELLVRMGLFVVLAATGVVVQWILMRRDRSWRPSLFRGRSQRFG